MESIVPTNHKSDLLQIKHKFFIHTESLFEIFFYICKQIIYHLQFNTIHNHEISYE